MSPTPTKSPGEVIRAARLRKGLRQCDVHGLSRSHVSQLERDGFLLPTPQTLLAIEAALGIQYEYLLRLYLERRHRLSEA